MREILFRGYNKNIKRFIFGDLIHFENEFKIIDKSGYNFFVDTETVGQFTGVTDKNGVKIFEGDVLQWVSCNPFSLGERRKVVVNYVNGWYFCVGSISVSLAELLVAERCEVIGSIHNNPERLI